MKKLIFAAISIFYVFVTVNSSVKMISSPSELEVLTINCHTNYSIIIEFPKKVSIENIVIDEMSISKWSVDHDLNLMWAQPEQIDSPDCIVIIKTDQFDQIKLRLRVEKDPKKLIHTIVLKESVFSRKHIHKKTEKKVFPIMKGNKNMRSESEERNPNVTNFKEEGSIFSDVSLINEKKKVIKKKRAEEFEMKNKKNLFNFDTFFSFSGGTQSFQDSSFAIDGEIIIAAKNESGLFFQGAGKTVVNDMLKQYGFSVGVGYEKEKLGFFLFGDILLHKLGEQFNSTTHFNLRPSARYRLSDKVHIAGFISVPLGAWSYTGIEVPGEPGFGYYNKSLFHVGLDLSLYLKKMFVDIRALIAEGSAFGIDLKAGHEIIRKIFVTINYMYQTTGDYSYLEGLSKSSRFGLGVTFNMRNFEDRAKDRIIFRPDYPMVVVAEKELDESLQSPEIILSGMPTTGYAPLNVSFKAIHKGFQGDVETTWFFNTTYSSTSSNKDSAFTYTLPGTYECYVEGRDEFGHFAKSNIIVITVLDINSTNTYTIKSSIRSGDGSIDPSGDTIVAQDTDQKFVISPAEGWYIKNVYCDGTSVGSVSEYEFKRVCEDHSIEVEFTETAPTTHTITVSVKNNRYGSVSPGNTQVEHGSDISFLFTPEDNNKHAIRYWVNGKQFNDEGIAEYSFENVTSDQSLEVEFDWIYFDVRVTLTLLEGGGGTLDPGPGTFTYKKGTDLTFNFNPDTISFVEDVLVNGNTKGNITTFKIYGIGQDEYIDVYIKRKSYGLDAIVDGGGCDCLIGSSIGQSGTGTYEVFHGDDIRFDFSPQNSSQTYWLGVQDNGKWSVMELPNYYIFQNVTGDNNYFRIKCADPGDPPPF